MKTTSRPFTEADKISAKQLAENVANSSNELSELLKAIYLQTELLQIKFKEQERDAFENMFVFTRGAIRRVIRLRELIDYYKFCHEGNDGSGCRTIKVPEF